MKTCFVVTVIFLLMSVARANGDCCRSQLHCDEPLEVLSVSNRPDVVSGVVATWIKFVATDSSGRSESYFVPYLSAEGSVPQVGNFCCVTYHVGVVVGTVGADALSVPIGNARIVDDLMCC